MNIKPKTYNELIRLARCLELKKYIPTLSDEYIEKMYEFLKMNPEYRIIATRENLSFVDLHGNVKDAINIPAEAYTVNFQRIILTGTNLSVFNGYSSDSGGDGGSSGNNNNNNNNNNG